MGDDDREFPGMHLLQRDYCVHTALSVRLVHVDSTVAVLSRRVDSIRMP